MLPQQVNVALQHGRRVGPSADTTGRRSLRRDADVGVYVEHGVCAIGVAGYDTIAEQRPNVLVPIDLRMGICRLASVR
jgi:ATP phosphoribosyltransferase